MKTASEQMNDQDHIEAIKSTRYAVYEAYVNIRTLREAYKGAVKAAEKHGLTVDDRAIYMEEWSHDPEISRIKILNAGVARVSAFAND